MFGLSSWGIVSENRRLAFPSAASFFRLTTVEASIDSNSILEVAITHDVCNPSGGTSELGMIWMIACSSGMRLAGTGEPMRKSPVYGSPFISGSRESNALSEIQKLALLIGRNISSPSDGDAANVGGDRKRDWSSSSIIFHKWGHRDLLPL